ncbi:DUF2637 domain-containing protein [Mycolicibacterium mageritense]|uniref:DUF2637 domain-containing protein n=1 Tax=Mycolicibacterium mageritense TaxID=53462 RepID=UPI0011D8447C|nr:DUF2637 domain-containing protein [Mycolicibacterium mageritense]TXI54407.1 MAG: DUF2637 domain-containing protein [Mycolicibacterium mageritense]
MTTPADLSHVKKTLWALLCFCTFASITANVAHAVLANSAVDYGWVGPVLIALLAPTILLWLMHLVGVWSRDIRSRGVVFWVILGTVVALAAVAFRLSFSQVRDLAMHFGLGHFDAALVPLMLDGVIVTCTLALVALSWLGDADTVHASAIQPAATPAPQPAERVTPAGLHREPAAVPQPVAQAEQPAASPVEQVADTAPTAPAEWAVPELPKPMQWAGQSGAEQAPVKIDASPVSAVYHDAPLADAPAEQGDTKPAEQTVTCDVPGDTADVPTDPFPAPRRLAAVPSTPRSAGDTGQAAVAEQQPERTPVPRDTGAATSPEQGADTHSVPRRIAVVEQDDEHARIAELIVDAGKTQIPAEQVAEILRNKAAGMPVRDIAGAAGTSVGSVQRITKAATELAGTVA